MPRTADGRRALATGLAVAGPVIGLYGVTVVTAWFWDAARFPLTAAGVARYTALGPVPAALVVVLVVAVVAGVAVGVVAVARRDQEVAPGPRD
jgi:hypothetical protein